MTVSNVFLSQPHSSTNIFNHKLIIRSISKGSLKSIRWLPDFDRFAFFIRWTAFKNKMT